MASSRFPLLRRSIIAGVVAVAVGVPAICATSTALADEPVTGSLTIYSTSSWYTSGQFAVTNTSSEAKDWSLSFRVPSGQFQNNAAWSTNASINGDTVTLTPKEKLAAGSTADISFGIAGQGTDELDVVGCDLDGHGVEGCVVGGGDEGDTEAPSFTEDLNARATGPHAVDLEWAAATDNIGVTEYRVFDGYSQKPVAVVDGSTLRTTIDDLEAGTAYAFHVFAYDKAGNHSGSTIAEVTTPTEPGDEVDAEAPSSVESITAEATSPSTVKLDWSAATDNVGVTEYRVYDGLDREPIATVDGDELGTTITGLTAETGYAFQVYAYDKAGNHGGSTVTYVMTPAEKDTVAPTVPTNLTVDTVDADTVHVMWNHSSDDTKVAGYKIFQDGELVKDLANGMRMTDIDGLEADTEYGFEVLAYDAAGNESAKTSPVTGTTGGAAGSDTERPSNVTCLDAVATSPTTVDLDWTAATDNVEVTSYKIYAGGKDPVATVGGKATRATVSGLTPDTTYSMSIHAYDAAGNHGISVMKIVHTPEETPGTGAPAPADFAAAPSSYNDGGRTMHRVEMTWTPDEATGRYEIVLDGKRVQTLLVGADRESAQKRYVLLGEHPKSSHAVKIRAQLANGQWSDYTATKTVQFTK